MHQKRFEVHEVVRVPVTVSPRARLFLHTSTAQGRAFPHALSEVFGELGDTVTAICVSLIPKARYFSLVKHDVHPVTAQETHLLTITVHHSAGTAHTWYVNAGHLLEFNAKKLPIFSAEGMARELLRLYEHQDTSRHNGRVEEEDAL